MLHGDISNHVKATFGFMCEDFVVTVKEDSFKDRVLNSVFGKYKRAEINELAKNAMEYTFRNTEFTVDLLVNDNNYSDLKSIIEDLPFCRIVLYNKYSQITSRLLMGDLTYVVDNQPHRMGLLNNPHVIDLDTFSRMTRR